MGSIASDGLAEDFMAEFCEDDLLTWIPSDPTKTQADVRYIWRAQSRLLQAGHMHREIISSEVFASVKASEAAVEVGDAMIVKGMTLTVVNAKTDQIGMIRCTLST